MATTQEAARRLSDAGRERRRSSTVLPAGLISQPAMFAVVNAKNKIKAKKPTIVRLLDTMEFNFVQQLEQNVVVYTLHSALIIMSVVAFVAETSPEFASVSPKYWIYAELLFALVFSIEVVLRYLGHLQNNSTFWTDPLIWVDILSIAPLVVIAVMCEGQPWQLTCTAPRKLWYIELLAALKILRVFKISRHFSGTKVLLHTFKQSMVALQAPFVFLFVSVTIFASLMYFLESGEWNTAAQAYLFPDGSSPSFSSVLDTAYFVIVTMTTVGYGDQSPESSAGKALAIMMMVFGVLFTAMPLTIVGNEFYDAMEREGDFSYDLDAEGLNGEHTVQPEIVTFERVSHEFVLVGAATTRLNRYLERVHHDPSNPSLTEYENEKHVLTLLRAWIRRHVKFMYTMRVLTTPNYHDKSQYAAWKKRVALLGFQRSFSTRTLQGNGAGTSSRSLPVAEHSMHSIIMDPHPTPPPPTFRQKLHLFLEEPDSSRAAGLWSNFIFFLIIITIIAFALEDQVNVNNGTPPQTPRARSFFMLDAVINLIFTVELLLRIAVTPSLKKFCFSMYNIFDFLAILPFFVSITLGFDSILMRLVRMLRIFKLSSRIEGTSVVVSALRASFRSLLIPVYMLIVITLVFGAALYLAERGHSVQEDGEEGFVMDNGSGTAVTGVMRAGWVIIVTMTTVGYGDITPQTAYGRIVCVIAMLFGILYMAMPIAIVGNNFWKAYEQYMKRKNAGTKKQFQEVITLPPQQQIIFELAVDSGKKLSAAVSMMDRRMRKLRRQFDDPEQPPPSAAIIAARMLDAMAEGESAVHKAILVKRAIPPHLQDELPSAASSTELTVDTGAGDSKAEEEESKAGREPLTPSFKPGMPLKTPKNEPLPPIVGGQKLVNKSRKLLKVRKPEADDKLLQHLTNFAPKGPTKKQFSYTAANNSTGVGLVRVVTSSYLDQLLALSEVLSYLHDAIELREMKRTVPQRVSIETARKAEAMFQRVIKRQKRKTALKRMANAMNRAPQVYS